MDERLKKPDAFEVLENLSNPPSAIKVERSNAMHVMLYDLRKRHTQNYDLKNINE